MPKIKRHLARYRAYRMQRSTKPGKGKPFHGIIALAYVAPNNEYALHATKGYRYRRLAPGRNTLLAALIGRLQ
jgi:hypothetical protein